MKLKIFFIFIFIFLYKVLKNVYNLQRINKLSTYFLTITTKETDPRAYETKLEVISLFKSAGIKDAFIPVAQPVGYGQLATYEASMFDAYPNNRSDFFPHYLTMFDTASGVFKYRIYEAFNPLYWIDTVIFAPRKILNYLGIDSETRSSKLLNLILTGIYWFVGLFLGIFSERVKTFILSYFP